MTRPLLLRPEATAEIEEARQWYERQRPGLGDEFLSAVREALMAVEASPQRYPVVQRDIRRAMLRRFPYSLLYIMEPDLTVVIACFHGKRNPRRWYSRH
jgi:plasmid stabilization system protein ParE